MPLIVLTGVNGFIGTNVCEKILSAFPEELGFEPKRVPRFSNFDSQTKSKDASVSTHVLSGDHEKDNTIRVVGSDLPESLSRDIAKRFLGSIRYTYCDSEDLFQYLENLKTPPDVIIHNGACSSTTETDKNVFEKLNVGYSKRIWTYCVEKHVPLIYASSAAVYGDGRHGFSDSKEDCHQYHPLNLYGHSKHEFDLWALEQQNTPPTWFGLRYFNVFGPHEEHKKSQASMVYHGYFQAVRSGKIRLFESNTSKYEDGEQERDFVYIDDIVNVTKALVRIAILRKKNVSELLLPENGLFLNVGTGIPNTWNSLATAIFETIHQPVNIEYIPIPQNIINQYQNYTCANISALMSLCQNYNFGVFQDSVKRYIQSYLVRISAQ